MVHFVCENKYSKNAGLLDCDPKIHEATYNDVIARMKYWPRAIEANNILAHTCSLGGFRVGVTYHTEWNTNEGVEAAGRGVVPPPGSTPLDSADVKHRNATMTHSKHKTNDYWIVTIPKWNSCTVQKLTRVNWLEPTIDTVLNLSVILSISKHLLLNIYWNRFSMPIK